MISNLTTYFYACVVGVWAVSSVTAIASEEGQATVDESEKKGRAIAVEANARNTGFVDSQQVMTMLLKDRKGRERQRTLRVKTLERLDDGDWSMTVFDQPADVKGTAMLTHSHGIEPDDQWLYLPALKRVKRISSKNRSGSFMGSEFSFEDMSAFEEEKYSYRYLRDEPCAEQQCFVSEWVPNYENSGYSKIDVWIDQEEYRTYKIDFYNKRKELIKTLQQSDFKLYKDKFWRSHLLEMQNHKTGKSTALVIDSYEFAIGLQERDFDQSALKRAK